MVKERGTCMWMVAGEEINVRTFLKVEVQNNDRRKIACSRHQLNGGSDINMQ